MQSLRRAIKRGNAIMSINRITDSLYTTLKKGCNKVTLDETNSDWEKL